MANEPRNIGSWSKPSLNTPNTLDTDRQDRQDRQDRRERRYGIISNLVTLLVTGIIIAIGFLLPTLLYPYLDFFLNETVQLARPSRDPIAEHVFPEPVPLYPWNLYDASLLEPLSSSERNTLEDRGIPGFLVATLRDYGLRLEDEDGSYYTRILNSFSFLNPADSAEPGCFVLYDTDLDLDGINDFRCAIDTSGNIISLIFVNDRLDTLQIEAPIGVATVDDIKDDDTPETTTGNNGDENGLNTNPNETETTSPNSEGKDPAGQNNPEQDNGTDSPGQDTTDSKNTTGDQDEDPDKDPNNETPPTPPVTPLPLDEDRYLWSYVYAISREARLINQQNLFSAFRQLEMNYESRYNYPFTMLLPIQPAEPESFPDVEFSILTPTVFATRDYLLYIYDQPDGKRLILYLDSKTMHCRGFNLLRY
jgi:hypothetical protein